MQFGFHSLPTTDSPKEGNSLDSALSKLYIIQIYNIVLQIATITWLFFIIYSKTHNIEQNLTAATPHSWHFALSSKTSRNFNSYALLQKGIMRHTPAYNQISTVFYPPGISSIYKIPVIHKTSKFFISLSPASMSRVI